VKTTKPSNKDAKGANTHYIEVSADTYAVIQHLKQAFEQMSNEANMEDEDVINVLVQWFIESVEADEETCHGEHDWCCEHDKSKKCCGWSCSEK